MSRPPWADTLPWPLIQAAATKYGLAANLVAAFVETETHGDTFCNRYEPGWKDWLTPEVFAHRLIISVDTERMNQAMSWGLMQVMGAVARELGFAGHLPQLTRPDIGLELGCKKLKSLLLRHPLLPDAIASYNAGSVRKGVNGDYINRPYVDEVLSYFSALGG